MTEKSLFIVIPCYNEDHCIKKLVTDLHHQKPDAVIVVVDDGSSDNSVREVKSAAIDNLVLLELPFNCGIGTAMQTGLLFAQRNNADFAVKFDGDGQHRIEEIDLLLDTLRRNEADMVIGSRFVEKNDGFKSTWMRRIGIRFFHFLSWILTGKPITDTTSGFRGYNRSALEFAAKNYPAFDYPEPEECILMQKNHFRVKEISCKMNERQGGSSSIHSFKILYFMIKVALSMIMAAMRPVVKRNLS